MAVSAAAMLAPEEVFAGKGDIKDEAELTQAERKRRRAKKKRKFKGTLIIFSATIKGVKIGVHLNFRKCPPSLER